MLGRSSLTTVRKWVSYYCVPTVTGFTYITCTPQVKSCIHVYIYTYIAKAINIMPTVYTWTCIKYQYCMTLCGNLMRILGPTVLYTCDLACLYKRLHYNCFITSVGRRGDRDQSFDESLASPATKKRRTRADDWLARTRANDWLAGWLQLQAWSKKDTFLLFRLTATAHFWCSWI